MGRSYYVIELSARWLTVLLVALALLMVTAFSLGYGAAWSVKKCPVGAGGREASPTPVVMTEVVLDPTGYGAPTVADDAGGHRHAAAHAPDRRAADQGAADGDGNGQADGETGPDRETRRAASGFRCWLRRIGRHGGGGAGQARRSRL